MDSKITSIQTSLSSLSELELSYHSTFSSDILPILDYLSQLFFPFHTFEFIQISFCLLQFFETSFWVQIGNYWQKNKFSEILHYITFFSSNDPSTQENIITFSIYVAIVFINSVLFLFLVIHYSKTRRIVRPILILVRLYFMIVGGLIIHPMSSLMGHLLDDAISMHKARDIFMLAITVIFYSISELLFYLNLRYINQSIYIHKSLWITFDSTLLVFMFMWNPLFQFIGHLFKFYPFWSYFILAFFHIIFVIMSFYNYLWMSCVHDLGNALQTSILCSLIFNDIFRIVVEYYPQIKQEIFVLICLAVFVIFTIVSYVITKLIRKRINQDLSNSKMNSPQNFDKENLRVFDPTIDGKFAYFNELGLDKNMKKAMIYLIVGLTSASDMFVDFSLPQFCIDNYKTNPEMIVLLIHLLSYFKSEKKRLNATLKEFHSLRTDYIYGHFIYMQAHRIKVFRQVVSTNLSSVKLDELKLHSEDLENQIKSFWSLTTASTATLEQLEKRQRRLNNLWDESIEDNWSSVSFREEHIHFLIESCADYHRAAKMENIKEKVELMNRNRDDLCFLSLLLCFPQYYEKKIVNISEIFSNKKQKNDSSNSSSSVINQENNASSSDEKVSCSSNEYDITQEEQIANTIISSGRLRLSMQNALNNVKPKMNRALVIYSIISILASSILIITTFAVFLNSASSFNDWNTEVEVVVDLRLAFMKSFLSLSIMAGKLTDRFQIDEIKCDNFIKVNDLSVFLDESTKFDELTKTFVDESRAQLWNLMDAILSLALKGNNISSLTSILYDRSITSNICSNGSIIDTDQWSMEKAINFEILSFAVLSDDGDNVNTWYAENTYWCHVITTLPDVEKMFSVVQNELTYDISNSSARSSNKIKIAMIVIGPAHFLFFVLQLPIIIYLFSQEINHLIKIMLSTDQEYKEQARKNVSLIVVNENNEIVPPITKVSFNWKIFLFSFLIFLAFCCFILFEELILYYSMEFTKKMRNVGFFHCYFSLTRSYIIEILIDILNAIYNVNIPKYYLTNEAFKERIYFLLKAFQRNAYVILNDSPECPSSVGKDPVIDRIVLNSFCKTSSNFVNLHDSYECASLNRLFATFHSLIEKITEEIELFDGSFKGDELSNLYHLIFVHLIPLNRDAEERFNDIQKDYVHNYSLNLILFFICGIVFLIIWSILMAFIINNFRRIFNMAICLIRRLSPVGFINNTELINYLLYKKSEEIEMGVTHAIFNSSFDGIICMNLDGIVEIINKSFANDYGYSTEQLVGQLIGTIFDNASREKLENQLKLIKNHESTGYTQDVICFTNDGRAVPSFITLFATKQNENSLILVIRDQTILLQKKKRLELAKKRSQDLLEQIMPSKVLAMIKEGKSEITFSVPSASVMFVDIVNFSNFSADLSPQQIMGTLSTLFGAFDVWIQKYPFMTKIKLIGDIYMAACGLFAVDEEQSVIAKQCIDFALHVLNILDDTNIKLNMCLQIRIGINSDGPIIAGVLGNENRVFDIIGDTINVASRLEHKAEPGHILMSEKTFNLVKDFKYRITPKGEMFLKGKGNMKAYEI